VIIFGDLHADNYTEFATYDAETGVNTRLNDCLLALKWIIFPPSPNAPDVSDAPRDSFLCLGDIANARGVSSSATGKVSVDTLVLLSKFFDTLQVEYFYAIPGNHDLSSVRDGDNRVSIWSCFPKAKEFAQVGDILVRVCEDRLASLTLVPVGLEIPDVLNKSRHPTILAAHGIPEEYPLAKYVRNTIPRSKTDQYDVVFLGDGHIPWQKGNIFCPGAPIHHNWGDVGRKCYILNYDGKTVEWIENIISPRFINADVNKHFRPEVDFVKSSKKVKAKNLILMEEAPESSTSSPFCPSIERAIEVYTDREAPPNQRDRYKKIGLGIVKEVGPNG